MHNPARHRQPYSSRAALDFVESNGEYCTMVREDCEADYNRLMGTWHEQCEVGR